MRGDKLGAGEADMNFPIKKGDFNYNLNTLLLLGAIAGGLITAGMLYSNMTNNDRKFEQWVDRHELLHKERQAIVDSVAARTDQRLTTLETERSRMENLTYRVTVTEQSLIAAGKATQDIQTALNTLSADVRVMSTILTRLSEAAEGPVRRRP